MTKKFTTTDGYIDANSFRFNPAVRRVTLNVTNTEVTAQFVIVDNPQLNPQAFDYNTADEKTGMTPGVWTWDTDDFAGNQIAGIRVRSSVAGAPAIVTVFA